MSRKSIFLVLIVIVLAVAASALGLFKDREDQGADNAGLIVGRNAIFVPDQAPSQNINVGLVYLERPGFVVIHEDSGGGPGAILGASRVLGTGETRGGVSVTLSRSAQEDETLYAMIHLDDGDGVFDPGKDSPAIDDVGAGPVMMIFSVGADFGEPSGIQL